MISANIRQCVLPFRAGAFYQVERHGSFIKWSGVAPSSTGVMNFRVEWCGIIVKWSGVAPLLTEQETEGRGAWQLGKHVSRL